MLLSGNGLLEGSKMYFHTPSDFAKDLLFYPISAGEFFCNSEYYVERKNNNSILALFVENGTIEFSADDIDISANKGDILFVDCYKPHKYFCTDSAHIIWVHFDGGNSRQWFHEITKQSGQIFSCSSNATDSIKGIIYAIEKEKSEAEISKKIYSLLCNSLKNEVNESNSKEDIVELAKKYIKDNLEKDVNVNEIAKFVHLSPSYFSQIFKTVTGITPYAYLLGERLEQSKQLLLKTQLAVSEIASLTGFNSDANFIYFFKNETGTTPLKYRKNGD